MKAIDRRFNLNTILTHPKNAQKYFTHYYIDRSLCKILFVKISGKSFSVEGKYGMDVDYFLNFNSVHPNIARDQKHDYFSN